MKQGCPCNAHMKPIHNLGSDQPERLSFLLAGVHKAETPGRKAGAHRVRLGGQLGGVTAGAAVGCTET